MKYCLINLRNWRNSTLRSGKEDHSSGERWMFLIFLLASLSRLISANGPDGWWVLQHNEVEHNVVFQPCVPPYRWNRVTVVSDLCDSARLGSVTERLAKHNVVVGELCETSLQFMFAATVSMIYDLLNISMNCSRRMPHVDELPNGAARAQAQGPKGSVRRPHTKTRASVWCDFSSVEITDVLIYKWCFFFFLFLVSSICHLVVFEY